LPNARAKVLADIRAFIDALRPLTIQTPASLADGIAALRQIRRTSYEELNQIQHEYLILTAAEWLGTQGLLPANATLHWNPRQTGDASEPDLAVVQAGKQIVAAEITASDKPVGTIDTRMAKTLKKLALMQGDKFYFVRTSSMSARAHTKVLRGGWPIRVVCLE